MSDLAIPMTDGQRRAVQSLKRQAMSAVKTLGAETFEDVLEHAASTLGSQAMKSDDELVVFELGAKDSPKHVQLKLGDISAERLRELGKLQDASDQFEALMVKQLFALMQKATPKNEFDGPMSDIAKDMFNDAVSQDLAKKGSVGLSSMLFKQLSKRILQQQAGETLRQQTTAEVDG